MMEVLVRGTTLLLAVCGVALLLRRAEPRCRHALWFSAIVALALLPLTLLLPAPVYVPSPASLPPSLALALAPVAARGERAAAPSPETPSPGGPDALNTLLLVVWVAGALVALARLAADLRAAWQLLREARPSTFAFDVVLSDRARVPMAWAGRVVLPAQALEWPRPRRESALRHEREHLVRRDDISRLLAQLTLCFWWFHPLAHLAVARLRVEAELACDEAVIASGVAPEDYAMHLVEVARLVSGRPSIVPAMARPEVSQRVENALSRRRACRWLSPFVTVACLALLAMTLARLTPEQARLERLAAAAQAIRLPGDLRVALLGIFDETNLPDASLREMLRSFNVQQVALYKVSYPRTDDGRAPLLWGHLASNRTIHGDRETLTLYQPNSGQTPVGTMKIISAPWTTLARFDAGGRPLGKARMPLSVSLSYGAQTKIRLGGYPEGAVLKNLQILAQDRGGTWVRAGVFRNLTIGMGTECCGYVPAGFALQEIRVEVGTEYETRFAPSGMHRSVGADGLQVLPAARPTRAFTTDGSPYRFRRYDNGTLNGEDRL